MGRFLATIVILVAIALLINYFTRDEGQPQIGGEPVVTEGAPVDEGAKTSDDSGEGVPGNVSNEPANAEVPADVEAPADVEGSESADADDL
jgi:hypothetical protein